LLSAERWAGWGSWTSDELDSDRGGRVRERCDWFGRGNGETGTRAGGEVNMQHIASVKRPTFVCVSEN
jgi:hypothetical protein